MKTHSLRNPLVLIVSIIFYLGCQMPGKDKQKDAGYAQAQNLEKKGVFFLKENEPDSALSSFHKCLAIYSSMPDSPSTKKDTAYYQKYARLYNDLSMIYNAQNNYDSALYYGIKSGVWECANPVLTSNRAVANANIANIYTILGDEKGKGTDKCKAIYSKGIRYATSACWEMDSLGVKSQLTLSMYFQAKEMYGMIGDTNRENFYRNKYFELKNFLNPGTLQTITPGPNSSTGAAIMPHKNSANASAAESEKDYDKRMSKRLDSIWNSVKPGTVTYTQDGKTTTVKTVINNGVATITTSVDGVLKKTETRKVN